MEDVSFSSSFSHMRGWLNVFRRRLEEGWTADKDWRYKRAEMERARMRRGRTKVSNVEDTGGTKEGEMHDMSAEEYGLYHALEADRGFRCLRKPAVT